MTIAFFVLAALMLGAALVFVLPPLLRTNRVESTGDVQRKLRALEQARRDGILTDLEYAAKRSALGETLLVSAAGGSPRSGASRGTALALALLLPAAAIVVYRIVGTPAALDPAALAAIPAAPAPADHGSDMDAAIGKLVDKLKENPKDAGGWALLGRAYRATQHFDEARDALKRAHELAPDDADMLVEYAEALALASPQHRIAGEPRALLDKAIALDPANQHALWLSGIADSQEKKYASAIATWNRLLPLLEKNSAVESSVHKQIAQAEALRDGRAPPPDDESATAGAAPAAGAEAAPSDSAATDAGGPHIAVKVSLDPKLKDKVAPGDVLFIYAKAASGPPMPLAIARLTAAQLPAEVTLTDGMGMLPSMRLSQFPQVIVGARISKSGNAIAQSGDLQSVSAPMANTRTEPLTLTIDQIVP